MLKCTGLVMSACERSRRECETARLRDCKTSQHSWLWVPCARCQRRSQLTLHTRQLCSSSCCLEPSSPVHIIEYGDAPLISSDQTASMTKAKLPFLDKEACEGKIHRLELLDQQGRLATGRVRIVYPRQGPNRLSGSIQGKSCTEWPRPVSDPVARQAGTEREEPREIHTQGETNKSNENGLQP